MGIPKSEQTSGDQHSFFRSMSIILEQLEKRSREYVVWYLSLDNTYFVNSTRDCHQELYVLATVQDIYNKLIEMKAPKAAAYEKKSQQLDTDIQRLFHAFLAKCDEAGIQLQ